MEMGRVELGLGTQGRMPRLLERGGGLLGGTNPCIASAADPAPHCRQRSPQEARMQAASSSRQSQVLACAFPSQ